MKTLRVTLALAVLAATAPALAAETPAAAVIEGSYAGVKKDAPQLTLELPAPWGTAQLAVGDPTSFAQLARATPGDIVRAELHLDATGAPDRMSRLVELRRPIGATPRVLALAGSLLGIILVCAALSSWRPQRFVVGIDNRYSNSQLQLALWFTAVASVYAATVVLRIGFLGWDFTGGVGMPANLITLTGLSALSYGGAKVITAQKVAAAAEIGQQVKTPALRANLLRDLVTSDANRADLGDMQMMMVTLAAVAIFVVHAFADLGELRIAHETMLPDVDTTLLASFGIGQGAYLTKKAAQKAGDG